MKKIGIITALILLVVQISVAQRHHRRTATAIRAIMADQESAWNRGDLPAFMAGYWASDSLVFIGSRGLTHGWERTLANYQRGYPDKATMGTLKFTILRIEPLSRRSAFVIGKWHLARPDKGDLEGHYTLLWKKINGQWRIVADHSS
jgi:ketosteroid isomerase-like protein